MTKEVLISISGLQFSSDSEDAVEMITVGNYYFKNKKHYVIYDEVMEGFSGVTKNTIKFSDNTVDIIKDGVSNVHMTFELHQKNLTYYDTPFGNILIGINTNKIKVSEIEDKIQLDIDYALDINYDFVADCKIKIIITTKDKANIKLQ
ncbi:MAG: DUF1934 domain-containing protein [Clostridiales bacterium]|nr:DUF1934 domain-containing protein [Clostridiales bacterium]